jgi:hypothetical protein
MRARRPSHLTWTALRWLVPMALLPLPGCSCFGLECLFPLDTPQPPQSWAVFCEIEDYHVPRRCATPADLDLGIRMANAAVALTRREDSTIGLDYSPEATQALGCPAGTPVAVTFVGAYAKGTEMCLNDGPAKVGPSGLWHSADLACVSKCLDLFGTNPPDAGVNAFCNQRARAATNFPSLDDSDQLDLFTPYNGACTAGGMQNPSYDTALNPDARRVTGPPKWWYVSDGVEAGITLIRLAPTTGAFDQGAATRHLVTEGDGYVEVTAVEGNTDRAIGVSSGILPDTDPTLGGIGFAVRLATSFGWIIHESGVARTGFTVYQPGDRFRIRFTDNFDGTATVTYVQIPASCLPPMCEGMQVPITSPPAPYPLRVDASLYTQWASLGDVRLVRVKKSLF